MKKKSALLTSKTSTPHLPPLTSPVFTLISRSERAFTLIEVLVSIAIIGVVFGVIISSTNALQKNSRDTQRKADLRNIQTALQQYYADQNFYPSAYTLTSGAPLTNCTSLSSCTISKTYMTTSPTEPQPGNSAYCYAAFATSALAACDNTTTKCHYYTLNTKLEGGSGSITSGSCANYNYQLTPIP